LLSLPALAFAGGIGPDPATLAPCDQLSSLAGLLDIEGCGAAPFSVFNVTYSTPDGDATSASDISLFTSLSADRLEIRFSGTLLDTRPADSLLPFSEYIISYAIDPPPPVILGFEMDLGDFGIAAFAFSTFDASAGIGTADSGISILTEICVGGLFIDDSCTSGDPLILSVDPLSPFASLFFDEPTNFVSVLNRIRVTEDYQLRNFGNATPLNPIPEPGTLWLAAAGLGLLWFRRR
jgi:hypothetical protein